MLIQFQKWFIIILDNYMLYMLYSARFYLDPIMLGNKVIRKPERLVRFGDNPKPNSYNESLHSKVYGTIVKSLKLTACQLPIISYIGKKKRQNNTKPCRHRAPFLLFWFLLWIFGSSLRSLIRTFETKTVIVPHKLDKKSI